MHAVPADQGLLEFRPTPSQGRGWWAGGPVAARKLPGRDTGALRLANRGTCPMYLFELCTLHIVEFEKEATPTTGRSVHAGNPAPGRVAPLVAFF